MVARTSGPFVTGTVTYGISEFELFFSRMAASQGGNISAIGGYLGGTITTASGTTSANWNTAYGWGNHASAGYTNASNLNAGTVAAARLSTASTQPPNDNSTKIATTAYVQTEIGDLIGGAPAALDTLNELAAAIGDDASYASSITTALAGKLSTTGKAADSNLLDGLDLHTGRNNEANKVVRTDGNGYIQAGWINTTSGANTTQAINRVYASTDTYIRYYSAADFGAGIGQHISYNDLTNKPTIPTNNNQLTNGAGYVTSSGNTIIGTDSDINTSGAAVLDQLVMTDGVITSHSTRNITLANLGYTGATNANNYSLPSNVVIDSSNYSVSNRITVQSERDKQLGYYCDNN